MRFIVIGETCTDRFVYSDINRLSPEAPVPVLRPIEIVENAGMSGNVVQNLIALNPELEVFHLHQREPIFKTRFVEKKSNHMFIRVDEGELDPCEPISVEKLGEETLADIKNADAVIISDYDKGMMSLGFMNQIAKESYVSVLDSKKKLDKSTIEAFTFIKLNESEYVNNKYLVDQNPEKFLITLGSKGVQFNGKTYTAENPQETIDVSGAGDTFVAAFTLKFVETGDTSESIIYANLKAGEVVTKRGVATPH